jgi:hypothetical protein
MPSRKEVSDGCVMDREDRVGECEMRNRYGES